MSHTNAVHRGSTTNADSASISLSSTRCGHLHFNPYVLVYLRGWTLPVRAILSAKRYIDCMLDYSVVHGRLWKGQKEASDCMHMLGNTQTPLCTYTYHMFPAVVRASNLKFCKCVYKCRNLDFIRSTRGIKSNFLLCSSSPVRKIGLN